MGRHRAVGYRPAQPTPCVSINECVMTTRKEAIERLATLVQESRSEVRIGLESVEKDLREAVHGVRLYASGCRVGLGNIGLDDYEYGFLTFDGEQIRALSSSSLEDAYNYGNEEERYYTSKHLSELSEEDIVKYSSTESINSIWSAVESKLNDFLGEAKSAVRQLSEFTDVQAEAMQEDLTGLMKGQYFEKQWAQARLKVATDPSDSLNHSNRFLESICRHYLEQRDLPLPGTKTAPELVAAVVKDFPFPSTVEGKEAKGDIEKLFGGIKSIGVGTGSFRTHFSTAHGGDKKGSQNDARLVNNLVGAAAIYILERLKERMVADLNE